MAESKLVSGDLMSENVKKSIKEQKQKVVREKRRADSEMRKAEEQRVIAEANMKKAMEEKRRADHYSSFQEFLSMAYVANSLLILQSGNIFNVPSFNLKKKLFTKQSHQVHLHCNNNLDASDFMKQTIDSNAPLLPCSVGNCAQCTSGIDSKMEPLLRGSNRQLLQSSALNSSTSLFSDGPLMGAQERGAFSVTASAIVAGEKSKSKSQSNISGLSGEVTRTRVHEKRKASCEEVALKLLSDLNGCTDIQRGEVQAFDAVMGDWGNLGSHEKLEGNYMKLLDLHNAVYEDRYRKAIQVPLSPTLPVIEGEGRRVFFSVLVNKISGIAMEEFRNFLKSGSIRFFESFVGHMHRGRVVNRHSQYFLSFSESFPLTNCNFLFMQRFLICRQDVYLQNYGPLGSCLQSSRILVYRDVSSHSLPLCGSMVDAFLNGKEEYLSYEMARTPQLLAGSSLLAALCAAIDHIGFLYEASYNIFRMHKLDGSLVLTILHIFAFVCGSKYFNHKDYGLIMTVIKSLVPFLEKRNIASDSNSWPEFPTCTQCPLSMDAVYVEIVV
ncbi:hypothetical protein RHMOL_Rhmol13G0158800 [Rhododendron molle]|uniref:Uncharacterized protein n=1 Tax=Rhododendron molle TaxID=49168 RepID=A0ACC0L853_RHOML|nr:hypothetical protein RHMOL_Rhmol13G0158800 [Rhododendron molle]